MFSLDHINHISAQEFIATLGGIYEHSPWVAESVVNKRPFKDVTSLQNAMQEAVDHSSEKIKLQLLKAHPEFAGEAASRGELTQESQKEQGRLNLQRLPLEQHRRMQELNSKFMGKFGFPGIVAVRRQNSVEGIFALLEQRLHNDLDAEIRDAMRQVHLIAECRLQDLLV